MEVKVCEKCLQEKPTWHFARWASSRDHWCRACKSDDLGGWKKQSDRRFSLLKKYGLYPEDWAYLHSLKPGCWCCGRSDLGLKVDHCHDLLHVRGLLCNQCNTGNFGDDVESIERRLAYLKADPPELPIRSRDTSTPDETKHPLYGRYRDLGARFREQGFTPEEWVYFEGFVIWSEANGWEPQKRLLRRGNVGPYAPSNCYWSTEYLDHYWPEREKPITAWGETKIFSEWKKDRRVLVDRHLFHTRRHHGWTAEDALSSPVGEYKGTAIQAFGDVRSVVEWLKDSRCAVVENTLRWRLAHGWSAEDAITSPVQRQFELNGVSKTPKAWLHDPIAQVGSYRTLMRRIKEGWSFEDALLTPDARRRLDD